jgi:hypothetical protein
MAARTPPIAAARSAADTAESMHPTADAMSAEITAAIMLRIAGALSAGSTVSTRGIPGGCHCRPRCRRTSFTIGPAA